MKKKVDIKTLSGKEADHLLRTVFRSAGLQTSDALPLTAETKQILLNYPTQLQEPDSNDEVTTLSLQILSEDPLLADFVHDEQLHVSTGKPKHFSADSISLISATTLALVVLSTYVHIKRNSDGKWSFEFKVQNSSESLKTEIIKLIQKLITILPDK